MGPPSANPATLAATGVSTPAPAAAPLPKALRVARLHDNLAAAGSRLLSGPGAPATAASLLPRAQAVIDRTDASDLHEPTGARGWALSSNGRTMLPPAALQPPDAALLASAHIGPSRPIYLAGAAALNPSLWRAAINASTPAPGLAHAPVAITAPDVDALLALLSTVDLTDLLAQPRVHLCLSAPALAEWLAGRLRWQIEGALIGASGPRDPLGGAAAQAVLSAVNAQQVIAARLKAQVTAHYQPRAAPDWPAQWAARLREGRPLGFILPTTRHSTFVQHAAADLAEALRAAGHRAEVVLEPDEHSTHTTCGWLAAVEAHRPDVVVLINYTRALLGDTLPAGLPVVTWIQDAMPQLFSQQMGASIGPMDVVVGHVFDALVRDFNWPAQRSLACPVLVSERKFHAGAAAATPLAVPPPAVHTTPHRFTCEIAYVSHQSQPAEALLAELPERTTLTLAGRRLTPDQVRQLLDHLWPAITDAVDRCGGVTALNAQGVPVSANLGGSIERACRGATETLFGVPTEPAFHAALLSGAVFPLTERVLRHQMLRWAAEIARTHGLRLHLHGNGWEQHPHLAEFARGPLQHGDGLRASYAGAMVHLHAAVGGGHHQRVLECALSGGLPLVRRKHDDLDYLLAGVRRLLRAEGHAADACEWNPSHPRDHGRGLIRVTDHPLALRAAAQVARLGHWGTLRGAGIHTGNGPLSEHGFDWFMLDEAPWTPTPPADRLQRLDESADAVFLMGDLEDTTFASQAELEAHILTLLKQPQRRDALSSAMAARVRACFTHAALVNRLPGLLRTAAEAVTA